MSRKRDPRAHLNKAWKRAGRAPSPTEQLLRTPLSALGGRDDTRTLMAVLDALPRHGKTLADVEAGRKADYMISSVRGASRATVMMRPNPGNPWSRLYADEKLRNRPSPASLASAAEELFLDILGPITPNVVASHYGDLINVLVENAATAKRIISDLDNWWGLFFSLQARNQWYNAQNSALQLETNLGALLAAVVDADIASTQRIARQLDALFVAWRIVSKVAGRHQGFRPKNRAVLATFAEVFPEASHGERVKNANALRADIANGKRQDLAEIFARYKQDLPLS